MKIAFFMNNVSAHELPLARETAKLVDSGRSLLANSAFLYVDAGLGGQPMQMLKASDDSGVRIAKIDVNEARRAIESWDVVVTGIRDLKLFEHRAALGLKTYYTSERWFKPILGLTGSLRMLVPSYRKMVKRFVKWANESPGARILAIGPWAKMDFIKIGISLNKIIDWGYYVKPSDALPFEKSRGKLRLLWCGRLLGLKRVGDIVRAVGLLVGSGKCVAGNGNGAGSRRISLTIVGDGAERNRLGKLVKKLRLEEVVTFIPSQPANKIREIMHEHDTFVFASNAYEGWGAVVSEALEEGMNVIGTYEAGAPAAILPKERLYHTRDVKTLAKLLKLETEGRLPACSIGEWTAKCAGERLMQMAKGEL